MSGSNGIPKQHERPTGVDDDAANDFADARAYTGGDDADDAVNYVDDDAADDDAADADDDDAAAPPRTSGSTAAPPPVGGGAEAPPGGSNTTPKRAHVLDLHLLAKEIARAGGSYETLLVELEQHRDLAAWAANAPNRLGLVAACWQAACGQIADERRKQAGDAGAAGAAEPPPAGGGTDAPKPDAGKPIGDLTDRRLMPHSTDYLSSINARPYSLLRAHIHPPEDDVWGERDLKEEAPTKRGHYPRGRLPVVTFAPDGTVSISGEDAAASLPDAATQAKIKAELAACDWPEYHPGMPHDQPPQLHAVMSAEAGLSEDKQTVFKFLNLDNRVVLHQHVIYRDDGGKSVVPYSPWSDHSGLKRTWHKQAPPGDLPIWGMEALNHDVIKDLRKRGISTGRGGTLFLHEGSKAARNCRLLARTRDYGIAKPGDHPWLNHLRHSHHFGWIGGCGAVDKTDFSQLNTLGFDQAIIVADNDKPGRSVIGHIAKQLRMKTSVLQFTDEFPPSFDLGDPLPEHMFRTIDGVRRYVGPSFNSLLRPATWATDPFVVGKTTKHVLRDCFLGGWLYVEDLDVFVHQDFPRDLILRRNMNAVLACCSDAKDTVGLILKKRDMTIKTLAYQPSPPGYDGIQPQLHRIMTHGGRPAFNCYVPSEVTPIDGDPAPFLDFVKRLLPLEFERRHFLRWAATLIAKPERHMKFGVLLVSETQGVGKSSLAHVLGVLVGLHNAAFPSMKQIVKSQFNSWIARKKLVVIQEIYDGSWHDYNDMKSYMTDADIYANEKFIQPYLIDNKAQFFGCSNFLQALKIPNDDRRWFIPLVTEIKLTEAEAKAFYDWLKGGGYGIVLHWAEKLWNDYVGEAEAPQPTATKTRMIHGSFSVGLRAILDMAETMVDVGEVKAQDGRPLPQIALGMELIRDFGQHRQKDDPTGRLESTDLIKKQMLAVGCKTLPAGMPRLKIGGANQYVILAPAAYATIASDVAEWERLTGEWRALPDGGDEQRAKQAECRVKQDDIFAAVRAMLAAWNCMSVSLLHEAAEKGAPPAKPYGGSRYPGNDLTLDRETLARFNL